MVKSWGLWRKGREPSDPYSSVAYTPPPPPPPSPALFSLNFSLPTNSAYLALFLDDMVLSGGSAAVPGMLDFSLPEQSALLDLVVLGE